MNPPDALTRKTKLCSSRNRESIKFGPSKVSMGDYGRSTIKMFRNVVVGIFFGRILSWSVNRKE